MKHIYALGIGLLGIGLPVGAIIFAAQWPEVFVLILAAVGAWIIGIYVLDEWK